MLGFNTSLRRKNLHIIFLSNYIERKEEINELINAKISQNYILNNVKINYFINETVSINLKINNINNIKYQDILGSPLPKRWPSIGIMYSN